MYIIIWPLYATGIILKNKHTIYIQTAITRINMWQNIMVTDSFTFHHISELLRNDIYTSNKNIKPTWIFHYFKKYSPSLFYKNACFYTWFVLSVTSSRMFYIPRCLWLDKHIYISVFIPETAGNDINRNISIWRSIRITHSNIHYNTTRMSGAHLGYSIMMIIRKEYIFDERYRVGTDIVLKIQSN